MELPCEYKYYARNCFYKSVEFSMALKLRAACYQKKMKYFLLLDYQPAQKLVLVTVF